VPIPGNCLTKLAVTGSTADRPMFAVCTSRWPFQELMESGFRWHPAKGHTVPAFGPTIIVRIVPAAYYGPGCCSRERLEVGRCRKAREESGVERRPHKDFSQISLCTGYCDASSSGKKATSAVCKAETQFITHGRPDVQRQQRCTWLRIGYLAAQKLVKRSYRKERVRCSGSPGLETNFE